MLDNATLFSLRLSLQVAGLATLLVLVSGIGLAYVLARKSFFGQRSAGYHPDPAVGPAAHGHRLLLDYPVRTAMASWAGLFMSGPAGPSCSPGRRRSWPPMWCPCP